MKQTLDLQDIPRFLACPGSFLLSQKAELLLGPVEDYSEGNYHVTLVPALPVEGYIYDADMEPGRLSVRMSGTEDSLIAATAGLIRQYDFAYEFDLISVDNGDNFVDTWSKELFLEKASQLQSKMRFALDSTERTPNEHCESCPARAICPEFTGEVLDTRLAKEGITTAEELGAVLPRLEALTEKAKQSVAKMLVQGTKVPGYRLGDGSKAWKDEDEAGKYLKRNVKKFAANLTNRVLLPPDEVQTLLDDEVLELNRPTNIDRYVKIMPGEIERES